MRPAVVLIACLVVTGSGVGVALASGVSPFPPSVYPPPVKARAGGALAACPNPAGLERFNGTSTKLAVKIAESYDLISRSVDLDHSDRAWWPQVRKMWRSRKPGKGVVTQEVYGSGPAVKNPYSVIVRFSCGAKLVAKSLAVGAGPHQTHPPYCGDCISTLFFVSRRGRALIYYAH
jgi:hypothetical protein